VVRHAPRRCRVRHAFTPAIAATVAVFVTVAGCDDDGDPTRSREYAAVVDERDRARSQRDALRRDVGELEQHLATLEDEVRELREQLDLARGHVEALRADRDAAEAERDAALGALEGADARRAAPGSGPMNDGVLTSDEADDVLAELGFARFLLNRTSLERIGSALCTAAEGSADAVELTERVADSVSGNIAAALDDDGLVRLVAVLGSKMCHDELARLGFALE
jgi:hypothetical protein